MNYQKPLRQFTIFLLLVSGIVLNSCTNESSNNVYSYTPTYSKNDCPMEIPDDVEVECGTLTTPEARTITNNDREVKLAVAVISKHSDTGSDDPVLYLSGGPGGVSLEDIDFYIDLFSDTLENRDLILLDQRGNGYSTPNLQCPEVDDITLSLHQSGASFDLINQESDNALLDCRDRLITEDINLEAYNVKENIADINDLRKILNISEWNIYGISYGTLIAQALLANYPESIRSITLDSVVHSEDFYPNLNSVITFQEKLSSLFTLCESQEYCNTQHPNLQQRFWDEFDRLNSTPVDIPFISEEYAINRTIDFSGYDLLGFARYILEFSFSIYAFPQLIDEVLHADYSRPLTIIENNLFFENFSVGTLFSTACSQATFDTSALQRLQELDVDQVFIDLELSQFFYMSEFCNDWGFDPTNKLAITDFTDSTPVLVLAGEYDIRTSSAEAFVVSNIIPNTFFAEIPNIGHGVLRDSCASQISKNFIAEPSATPDTSCIDEGEDLVLQKPNQQIYKDVIPSVPWSAWPRR